MKRLFVIEHENGKKGKLIEQSSDNLYMLQYLAQCARCKLMCTSTCESVNLQKYMGANKAYMHRCHSLGICCNSVPT